MIIIKDGVLLVHTLINGVYQWGIVNISTYQRTSYITSDFQEYTTKQ